MGIWDKFAWPVPVFAGRVPVVSSGFSARKVGKQRRHRGVDITYPRPGPGAVDLPWKSKLFEVWPGVPILAVGPGRVWGTGTYSNGVKWIIVDHHNVPGYGPLAVEYMHVDDVKVAKGDPVTKGQLLAYMGYTGTDQAHLHFATSTDVKDKWGVDPETLLDRWAPAGITPVSPTTPGVDIGDRITEILRNVKQKIITRKIGKAWPILLLVAIALSSKR